MVEQVQGEAELLSVFHLESQSESDLHPEPAQSESDSQLLPFSYL
jgi:hypothetical protein